MAKSVEDVISLYERKNRKREQFIALLRDPDVQDIVSDLLGEKGPVSEPHREPARTGAQRGGLRAAIRALYSILPQRFGLAEVRQELEKQDFQFARNPVEAIRDQLYALEQRGELRVAEQGGPGRPNVYERTT